MKKKSVDTILIVDDDPEDIEILVEFLQRRYAGLCVPFRNGSELLAYLENTDSVPNLIVLDVNMSPKDGFQLLVELKAHDEYHDIPVMILTTSARPADEKRCYDLGCRKFFCKPSTAQGYRQIVEEMLKEIGL